MNPDFVIIAITPPVFLKNEAETINKILSDNEAHYLHIRKPGSSESEIVSLLKQIHPSHFSRLKLHDHFQLVSKYNLGGIHLNSRNPEISPEILSKDIDNKRFSVSKSVHSVEELDNNSRFDYQFISPVFDSISKKGYNAGFNLTELSDKIKGKNVIALGGVTPDKFPLLKSLGFRGAALLGHFFPDSYQ